MIKNLSDIPRKFKDEADSFAMKISSNGTLILQNGARPITFYNFIIFNGDQWFAGRGFQRASSLSEIPDKCVDIGVKSPRKLLLFREGAQVEFITKKNAADNTTRFFLWLPHPNALEITFVSGDISPSMHSILLPNTDEMIDFSKALAMLIIRSWDANAAEKIAAMEDPTNGQEAQKTCGVLCPGHR